MFLHLMPAVDWVALRPGESVRPESLATEGFAHCTSGEELMLRVANSFYRSLSGEILALVIDPDRVAAPIKWEFPPGADPHSATAFPHIYGPINHDAIVGTRRFQRAVDGSYTGLDPIH
jgi:uncharacterized protein (DUF952 family)